MLVGKGAKFKIKKDKYGEEWIVTKNTVRCPYCGYWHARLSVYTKDENDADKVFAGSSWSGMRLSEEDCPAVGKFTVKSKVVKLYNEPVRYWYIEPF